MWKKRWEDGITPEVLKYVSIDDIVFDIITKSYINSEQPDLWNISNIVPTSGDLIKAENYHGISLTSIMAKTYNRMILNRIRLVLYLFIIVLDYALRKAINGHKKELGFTIVPRRSRRLHPTVLTYLDFADDIII